MERLADTFRTRRISLGLSQAQAASAAGLSLRTVTSFEAGGTGLSLGNLGRLLAVVGLELATRDAAPRPTLDEVESRYAEQEAPVPARTRVPRKRRG